MAALAAGLPRGLEELDLSKYPLGDEGVVAIAAELPCHLRVLILAGSHTIPTRSGSRFSLPLLINRHRPAQPRVSSPSIGTPPL